MSYIRVNSFNLSGCRFHCNLSGYNAVINQSAEMFRTAFCQGMRLSCIRNRVIFCQSIGVVVFCQGIWLSSVRNISFRGKCTCVSI